MYYCFTYDSLMLTRLCIEHCCYWIPVYLAWNFIFNAQVCFDTLIMSCLAGIKDYSNWPTIPQIFINGEFIGGCDIMIELHQKGELVEELKKVGIKSALTADSSNSS
jgi:hypothetical protein